MIGVCVWGCGGGGGGVCVVMWGVCGGVWVFVCGSGFVWGCAWGWGVGCVCVCVCVWCVNVGQDLASRIILVKCPPLSLVDNNSAKNICVFVMGFIDYFWNSWFVCIGVDLVKISRLSCEIYSCHVFVFLLFHFLLLAYCFVWIVTEFINLMTSLRKWK